VTIIISKSTVKHSCDSIIAGIQLHVLDCVNAMITLQTQIEKIKA